MKKMQKQSGFTLIELLVVIAIIALLAGLLFPAVSAALNTAKKAKAKTQTQNIETAIMVYFNEYNRLPVASSSGTDSVITADESESKDILKVLMALDKGPNVDHKLNPKRIVFLETEVPSEDGTYLDPWETQIKILLDLNLDNTIDYLSGSSKHRKRAVVVSAGKDQTFGANSGSDKFAKDNIANVDLPGIN